MDNVAIKRKKYRREARQSMIQAKIGLRKCGEVFKSEFEGKVKDAKLTVELTGKRLDSKKEKEAFRQFKNCQKQWEQDMVRGVN